ncbi:MAG: glycosyltransferase [Isosphaeraceae bacterium]|nr:glycosyltransferase [Isosphaeraceae bacterium]
MADVTVILTAYRRPELLQDQVRAVRAQTEPPREIWVWANEPTPSMLGALERAGLDRVVTSSRNDYVHARFALALTAPTEFVALFDDDTMPGRGWLANCRETFRETPGILGSAGVRIHGGDYQRRSVHGWHDPSNEAVEVDLVGHAWFLKTEWVHYLFTGPAGTGTNGEDIELSARAWRLGGIRTYCPPHPPDDRTRWGSLDGAVLGDDPVALSRRPSHLEERDRIVRAELAAGWQPLGVRGEMEVERAVGTGRSSGLADHRAANLSPRERVAAQRPGEGESPHGPVARPHPDAARPTSPRGRGDGIAPSSARGEGAGSDARSVWSWLHVTGHRVLVIGHSTSALAALLKEHQPKSLTAVELGETADEMADDVDFPPGSFDAIVSEDLLERVRRPDRLLRRLRSWVAPDGRFFSLLRNARRHRVVEGLLEGRWLGAEGASRPVRFFTRREIEKLLLRAGFGTASLSVLAGPGHGEWVDGGRRSTVRVGRLHVGGLAEEEAEEFFTSGYLVEAQPEQVPEYGTTSIVIVTHNQLEYTRMCVESIRRLTDEAYELIFVDNASTDGTVEYLQALPGATVIANGENRGFPAGANQGIEAAGGDQVLLLNNDTVVTTSWLRRLLGALYSDAKIGLVGPCSNCVSGEQQVAVAYDDLGGLDGFAWEWGKANHAAVQDTSRLIGFCLLIRRATLDAVGLLDERFGVGCFEDDDYCLRALQAGWRAVIARDAFVHHYGGRTFVGSGADFAAIMRENERRFREKWQGPRKPAIPAPVPSQPPAHATEKFDVVMAPDGGLLLQRQAVRLSLCMIVRDSSRTLPPCLESIRPWVDEMVIVDTGSVDDTPQIVEAFGGRLFHFPWCDDFSAARNESLRHARGEWLFWMDSDDTIDADCGRRLRALAYTEAEPSLLGYVVQVHCPGSGEDGSRDITAVDHVKLFRNRPDLRFEGRIHEQILPAIRRASGDVAWTDLFVVHSGSDQSPEAQERKRERDLRILHQEFRERPDHPFTLFNLGMTYADGARYEEAAGFLKRSIANSGVDESHLRKAYALLLYAEMQLGRTDEASATCRRARELFPDDAELRFRQGVLLHDPGCLEEAARAYQDVLENREERHFSSVDRGIFGFKARQNLAVVYTGMGDAAAAERQWRLVVEEVPAYRAGWRGLGDSLLRQGKLGELQAVIEHLRGEQALVGEANLLAGRVASARGDVRAARTAFERAVAERPEDAEPHHALCQLLFEHATPDEVERALGNLVGRDPTDASAHHNLGTLYLRTRRYQEAVRAYRESIRHRPDAAATHLHLVYALKESGHLREAVAAWEQVLRLAPGDPSAQEELRKVERPGVLVGARSGRK